MEGNTYLFRIPSASTRNRVLTQRLWQIEGQTMFIAKWEPGVTPAKPKLTSAPIWLELRDVLLQFFHDEGLEHIAGLVGDPKFLHPATANKTNLEVAKVFTIIDPRKPLPEAVNVQFDSGGIRRIRVSSPWMPRVCPHCNEVGHRLRHCTAAPITCDICASTAHSPERCPRAVDKETKARSMQNRNRPRSPSNVPVTKNKLAQAKEATSMEWVEKDARKDKSSSSRMAIKETALDKTAHDPQKEPKKVLEQTRTCAKEKRVTVPCSPRGMHSETKECVPREEGEIEEESSDSGSSDSGEEEFQPVLTRRQQRAIRGKGLKHPN